MSHCIIRSPKTFNGFKNYFSIVFINSDFWKQNLFLISLIFRRLRHELQIAEILFKNICQYSFSIFVLRQHFKIRRRQVTVRNLKDKTMADKLMYSKMMIDKITPSVDYN